MSRAVSNASIAESVGRAPSYHVLTMSPEAYRALCLGLQHAVVLPVSVGLELGDQLVVRERARRPETEHECTDVWLCRKVTHVERGYEDGTSDVFWNAGIDERFAVYSLNSAAENAWSKDGLEGRLRKAVLEGKTPDEFWMGLALKEGARRGILRPMALHALGVRAS